MKQKGTSVAIGRPREFDLDEALDRAMRVFWQKGYAGASLSDLTKSMRISRPSLYAAFGNKESLFRKAIDRYLSGPASFNAQALGAPTARKVAERVLLGTVEIAAGACNPAGCMFVHATLSCSESSDPLHKELRAHRLAGELAFRKRFERAVKEGDLPMSADPVALARLLNTLCFGLAVQAASGATRAELLRIVKIALKSWSI